MKREKITLLGVWILYDREDNTTDTNLYSTRAEARNANKELYCGRCVVVKVNIFGMDGCEEQDGNAPKYCKEILKAAINEEVTFKYIDIKPLASPTN